MSDSFLNSWFTYIFVQKLLLGVSNPLPSAPLILQNAWFTNSNIYMTLAWVTREWNFFLLTYTSGCLVGALILIWVPSITPIILANPGNPQASKFHIISWIHLSKIPISISNMHVMFSFCLFYQTRKMSNIDLFEIWPPLISINLFSSNKQMNPFVRNSMLTLVIQPSFTALGQMQVKWQTFEKTNVW